MSLKGGDGNHRQMGWAGSGLIEYAGSAKSIVNLDAGLTYGDRKREDGSDWRHRNFRIDPTARKPGARSILNLYLESYRPIANLALKR
jgi:hypothetical protein